MTDDLSRIGAALADRYRIERELGAGGMATVYLAEDLKHHRKVAVKVLRPELAAIIGAARFLVEIKTTANLQHPHILALHDSGEVDGTVFYVMPFVDGESLRDRLTREKQLPIDDAIRIATEVAGALHYAHGHGVIHRDIKPENILLHGGHALVADFGIALAASSTAGARMTETGMSLGTPTYMSPEQAMGERTLDARTDVYALGCVLYEMLVGDPPHTGSTAQAVVAKVLTEKPAPIVAQRDRVPAFVEDAVLAALEKLPADRPASAATFIRMLEGQHDGSTRRRTGASRTVRRTVRLPVLLSVAAVLTAGGAATGWFLGHRQVAAPSSASSVVLPDSLALDPFSNNPEGMPTIALSPDGSHLVFAGRRGGRTQLYIRRLSDFSVRALDGTEGAIAPFFSPDGGAVAFFAGTALKQISLTGGQVRTLTPSLSDPFGGTWLPDGRLLVANLRAAQLLMLGPNGDSVRAFVCALCSLPEPLPDGRRALVTGPGGLQIIDLDNGRMTPLPRWDAKNPGEVLRGTMARLDGDGHLAYVGPGGQLFVVPFDAAKGEPTGAAVSLAEDVRIESGRGGAQFALARSGMLAWAVGGVPGEGYLVRADRTGRLDTIPAPPANYNSISMTPDGRRLVVRVGLSTGDVALQIIDVESGRVTPWLSGASLGRAAWMADGRRVVFGRDTGTFIADPESSAPPRSLALPGGVADVSPMTDTSSFSAWLNNSTVIVHTDGRPTEHVLGQIPVNGTTPDNRWIMSEEAGTTESAIVARSLDGSGRRLVIAGGSRYSMVGWAGGGNEFILADVGNEFVKADAYRIQADSARGRVIQSFSAVRYDPSNTDRSFGEPQRLFGAEVADFPGRNYAVAMGGNRFVFKQRTPSPPLREVRLLTSWHQRLTAGGRP